MRNMKKAVLVFILLGITGAIQAAMVEEGAVYDEVEGGVLIDLVPAAGTASNTFSYEEDVIFTNSKIMVQNGTDEDDPGWIVYKFTAAAGTTIAGLSVEAKLFGDYRAASPRDMSIWYADSWNETGVPDPATQSAWQNLYTKPSYGGSSYPDVDLGTADGAASLDTDTVYLALPLLQR